MIKYIMITTFIYLITIVIGSPYVDLRYIMPIIPLIFIILIHIIVDLLENITNQKVIILLLVLISNIVIISMIPKLSNNLYTYKGARQTMKYIEENLSHIPCIYSYEDTTAQYNKTMECYEALIKIDNTYIMKSTESSSQKVREILKDIDISNGITIIMNVNKEQDTIEHAMQTGLFSSYKIIGNLGRFIIYVLE